MPNNIPAILFRYYFQVKNVDQFIIDSDSGKSIKLIKDFLKLLVKFWVLVGGLQNVSICAQKVLS